MADRIGSSFSDEIKQKAGLTDLRFSWGSDGEIIFQDGYPEAQKKLVYEVLEAHNPLTVSTILSPTQAIEKRLLDSIEKVVMDPQIHPSVKGVFQVLKDYLRLGK